MKRAIIIDMDNCWMDSRKWLERSPLIQSRDKMSWDNFYKLIHLCKPNKRFITDILSLIDETKVFPVFITSRSDDVYKASLFQIENNSSLKVGETCELYMRTKEHGYAKSAVVKKDIINSLLNEYSFVYAIDDSDDNLKTFKELGIETVIRYVIDTHDYERL